MKKYIYALLLLLVSLFATSGALAQNPKGKMRLGNVDSIDRGIAEFHYLYTNKLENWTSETVLQVGRTMTKFVNSNQYYRDSLSLVIGNDYYDKGYLLRLNDALPKRGSRPDWTLYDNYPEGKTSIVETIAGLDHYLTEEERVLPEWEIVPDSTRNVSGYDCQLAVTNLYGRRWLVWFAPSVAMPHGPWLLRGLPGLVVAGFDSDREHTFVLQRATRYGTGIGFSKHQFIKASRQKAMQARARYNKDRAKYLSAQTGIDYSGSGVKNSIPYNPIRRLEKE